MVAPDWTSRSVRMGRRWVWAVNRVGKGRVVGSEGGREGGREGRSEGGREGRRE